MILCRECSQPLTDEEIYYYENHCNQCEAEWCDEIERWQAGEPNAKLDELYEVKKVLQ